jgi:serine/threonine protein kinase
VAAIATTATRRDTPVHATSVTRSSDAWSLHASGTRTFGRYELIGEVATGGMATVYLGRMRRPMGFSRLVAIKSMHPQYAKDPDFVSMFVDEARLTARVRHPNVVPTLDIVAEGGQLVIVMEYVEGETLGTLFKSVKKAGETMPPAVACALIHDLLLGLHEAHETADEDGTPLAIIHRDVSPQNVIVGLDGLTRVLDFGVAKARRTVHSSLEGEIKGKIPYMPPEQLFGESIDRRVDVYAAGVLLWESLTGERLFDGPTDEALAARIADEAIDAPSKRVPAIPAELDAVVLRALARAPSERFTTALAMAERLTQVTRIATRSEVAAWMKRFAHRREIPSCPPEADPVASAVVETLERSSPAPAEARRPFPVLIAVAAVALVLGAAGVGWRARAATEQPTQSSAAIAAAIAASTASSVATTTAATTKAATAAAITAVPTDAKVTEESHAVDSTSDDTAPATKPVGHAVHARIAAKVNHEAALAPAAASVPAPIAAPSPVTAPVQTSTHPSVSCRPPYTVDADGHRHYKVECL